MSSTCGDPFNITVPLSCDGVGTWLHIIQETYGSADPRTGYCAFAPGCPQASLSSSQTMLKCSCNGPSPQNKNVCEEDVIATKEMLNACGQVTDSAIVGVQYRCIPATEIIDMCGDIHWTSDGQQAAAFLATPQFSNPPVLNAHCTCNITGEALKLQILELQADIDLVMEDPLNIIASDGDVWSAATFCKKCHVEKFNEVVYHSAKNYSELTVNFQDNRRAGQRVWLEIQGGSQTLAISCHATTATPTELTTSTLPATITTAPVRTTSSTDATTTMLMTKATYSTVTAVPTIGVLPHIISTKSAPTLKDPDVLTSTTAVLTHRQTENSSSKEEVNNNGQNVALVMGLFFVAVILVAVAITLAVLLWRRYQQIQKDGAEVYITHNSWNIFSLVFWYQHCHDTRKSSMSSTQQTLHFADLTKSIWLQEQNSEEVPRGNRLNHNDTMSDSALVGSHTEVLCESHNHNICLGQSENTPRGNVESNNSQTEAGSLGNSSATNPMQAHNASGYAASNCTFQIDMEDADFHTHAPDCNDFVNVSDGSSSLLKQDRDDAGLEKLIAIHNAFLQEENQSGKELYALEQENKEQAYSAKPLQHQGTKEKKSTSPTPLHREEGPSSEKLTQNKNIGGRKLGLHASNIHNSHYSWCEKLQGSPTGTLVKKEMSCEECARESKSKRSKGQKTEDGKKIGDVTNKVCTENSHDSESRKNKTGEIVSRVLGQTLEGIINQRRGLFLEQNGLPGLNSDLQQQQETSENKSTSQPNSDYDVDSHSELAAKQDRKRQRRRPKAHYHLFLDGTESNNSSNV